MGGFHDVYSLYQYQKEQGGEAHYLLLCAFLLGYSNARQQEEHAAYKELEASQKRLRKRYETAVLPSLGAAGAKAELIGELALEPVGEQIYEVKSGTMLDIWVAEIESDRPWVVLGTAVSEAAFWQEVQEEYELQALKLKRPAKQYHVYFLKNPPYGAPHAAPHTVES